MKIKIGIDASRNRSGGAIAHLRGILEELDPSEFGISEIHVWSYDCLLEKLPNRLWLVKHRSKLIEGSILHQLFWQYFLLSRELSRYDCSIVLNCDGGTVSKFQPSVTMSRDMLSYEEGEIRRYIFTKQWLRLFVLKFVQNAAFSRSSGVIFLTNYAANKIMKSCGKLKNFRIIPHGVSDKFRLENKNLFKESAQKNFKLLYVSNVDLYKHHWNVVAAVSILRKKGWDLDLTLVGGGTGRAMNKLEKALEKFDPKSLFVTQLPFVAHSEIPNLLSQCDIFVFASSCENMPNTLVEAMCAQLPIACSGKGPMPEVLDDGGVYFDPEDVESVTKALLALLNSKSLRQDLAVKAKELSTAYSWKRCGLETLGYLVSTYKETRKTYD